MTRCSCSGEFCLHDHSRESLEASRTAMAARDLRGVESLGHYKVSLNAKLVTKPPAP